MLSLLVAGSLVAALPASAAKSKGSPERVTICHKPGTPAQKTLSLPSPAVGAHLAHGDALGPCGGGDVPCTEPETSPVVPPDTGEPVEEEAWVSEAVATLDGASQTAFNPAGAPVSFTLSCPTLAMAEDTVAVYLNGRPIPFSALTLASDRVTLTTGLDKGRNEIALAATDVYGYAIHANYVLWAGAEAMPVTVLDETGTPAAGATVAIRLADDSGVTSTLTTDAAGQGMFANLPARSFNLVATASGNRTLSRRL